MIRRNGVMDMIAAGSSASSVMKTAICMGVLSVMPPPGLLPKTGTDCEAGAASAVEVISNRKRMILATRLMTSAFGGKARLLRDPQIDRGAYSRWARHRLTGCGLRSVPGVRNGGGSMTIAR